MREKDRDRTEGRRMTEKTCLREQMSYLFTRIVCACRRVHWVGYSGGCIEHRCRGRTPEQKQRERSQLQDFDFYSK